MKISRWSKADVRWFLAVRCEKCDGSIFFALDYGDGVEGRQNTPPGKLVLTCPLTGCGHKADYTAAAITRRQKEQPLVAAE
jgi:hypothetical protein